LWRCAIDRARFDSLPERWRVKLLRVGGPLFTECWLWRGWNSADGYGKLRVAGRACMAHRAIYERLIAPIPSGFVLDHLCRNRACCNPDHLEPVTPRENVSRGAARLFQKASTEALQ